MREGWIYKKLGEVCEFKSGFTPKKEELLSQGNYPYFKVAEMNLEGNELYLKRTTQYLNSSKRIFPKGAIVFPKNGGAIFTNKKRILAQDSIIDMNTQSVIANANLEHSYLYYVIQNIDFSNYVNGSALPTLALDRIKDIQVPIFPITTQQQIVSELDLLSHIIDQKRQQLKEYDALAESIFYDMFGDPVENPKGWEKKKLGDTTTVVSGFAFPSKDFKDDNPLKVIKITNVGVGEFVEDNSSLPAKYSSMNDYKVKAGSIIIALTRTVISSGFKRAYVSSSYDGALLNQRVATIVEKSIVKDFLYYYLGTAFVKDYVLEKSKALMQPNLSVSDLRNLPLYLPPLPLQRQFAAKIESIEQQKQLLKESIKETEMLFQSRMDYWFNS